MRVMREWRVDRFLAKRKTKTRDTLLFWFFCFVFFNDKSRILKQQYIHIMIHSVLKLRSPVTFGTVIFSDCSDLLEKYNSSDFHSWNISLLPMMFQSAKKGRADYDLNNYFSPDHSRKYVRFYSVLKKNSQIFSFF